MATTTLKKLNRNVNGLASTLAAQSDTGKQLQLAQQQLAENRQEQAAQEQQYMNQANSEFAQARRNTQANFAAGMTQGGALYNSNQVTNQLGQQVAQTQASYGQYEAQAAKQQQQYDAQEATLEQQYRQVAAEQQYANDAQEQASNNKKYKGAALGLEIGGGILGTLASIFTGGLAAPAVAAGIGAGVGALTGVGSGVLNAKGSGANGWGQAWSGLTQGLIGGAFGALGGLGMGEGAAVKGASQLGEEGLAQAGLKTAAKEGEGFLNRGVEEAASNLGFQNVSSPEGAVNGFTARVGGNGPRANEELDMATEGLRNQYSDTIDTYLDSFDKYIDPTLKGRMANDPELYNLMQKHAGNITEGRLQTLMGDESLKDLEPGSPEWHSSFNKLLSNKFGDKNYMKAVQRDIFNSAKEEYAKNDSAKKRGIMGLLQKLNPAKPTQPFNTNWRTIGRLQGGRAGSRAFTGALFRKSPWLAGSIIGQSAAGNLIANKPGFNQQKQVYKKFFAENGWDDLIKKYGL